MSRNKFQKFGIGLKNMERCELEICPLKIIHFIFIFKSCCILRSIADMFAACEMREKITQNSLKFVSERVKYYNVEISLSEFTHGMENK